MENLDLVREWKEQMEVRHTQLQRYERLLSDERKIKENAQSKGVRRPLKSKLDMEGWQLLGSKKG